MRLNGNLISYLQSVDEQADEMCFQTVKQLAKQEGVTEELKRRDQMAWVGEIPKFGFLRSLDFTEDE